LGIENGCGLVEEEQEFRPGRELDANPDSLPLLDPQTAHVRDADERLFSTVGSMPTFTVDDQARTSSIGRSSRRSITSST
jgi:hypothetical protein